MITPTDDDKKAEAMLFIDFMRRMLDWDPDERLSAKQLIEHKWFDSCRDEFRGEEDHPDV